MKTIIFISRHSLTQPLNYIKENENVFIQNIKTPLSIDGEKKAEQMSNYDELKNIDVVYSSNYSRAMSTAKYVANNNGIDINIDYRFGERIHGVEKDYKELPTNFGEMQLLDENYKFKNGESRKEVSKRIREGLFDVIENNKGKRIYITSHSTAMIDLFITFGKLEIENEKYKIIINDKVFIDSDFKWNEHTPELFKLEFNENELNNIEYINW